MRDIANRAGCDVLLDAPCVHVEQMVPRLVVRFPTELRFLVELARQLISFHVKFSQAMAPRARFD